MKNNNCPHCGEVLSGSKCLDNEGQDPDPGVITVCVHCASVLKYTEDMDLVQVTDQELDQLEPETIHQLFLITSTIDKNLKENYVSNIKNSVS